MLLVCDMLLVVRGIDFDSIIVLTRNCLLPGCCLIARFLQYMQRGGTWDNSDVQGAKNRKRWLNSDKEYAADESKKQNSFSILGWGEGLDWTGTQRPGAGPAAQFGRNYKAPNVRQMKKDDDTASGSTADQTIKKKKLFGIF